ncbi:MAG TPA: sialidase family protein [Actinomycetota bacterium]|nr:sialidase family protein [Actinomycetota bacterium]
MTRAWPARLAIPLALFAMVVGASGAGASSPVTRWAAHDVRVNDPSVTYGGPPMGLREPVLAIDPTNPRRMLVAAIDQNYSNTNAYGSWAGAVHLYRSSDGGSRWTDGGLFLGPNDGGTWTSGDPSLAFDRRGRAWLVMLADDTARTPGRLGSFYSKRGGVYVYRSDDGGRRWRGPFQAVTRVVNRADRVCAGPDKELVAVGRPGEVFIAYTMFHNDCPRNQIEAYRSLLVSGQDDIDILLVRSTDGGRTWSPPTRIWHAYAVGAQPAVGPDGTIFVAFTTTAPLGSTSVCPLWEGAVIERAARELEVVVASSNDDGHTWRYERRASCDLSLYTSEGTTGLGARIVSISVDPSDGRAYVLWSSFLSNPSFGVHAMSSGDGGRTWSPTVSVTPFQLADSFLPSVAASAGVARAMWLTTADLGRTFDVLTASSTDGGSTWSAPTSLSTAPSSGDGELGDYIWIDVVRRTVAAAWTDFRSGPATNIFVRTGSTG